jgi:hypothetical protein
MLSYVLCSVAVVGAPTPVPSELFHFTVQQKMDTTPGNDIGVQGYPSCGPGHAGDGKSFCNVDALKVACLNTVGCTGFNTDGWLKNNTVHTTAAITDLYTKVPGKCVIHQ